MTTLLLIGVTITISILAFNRRLLMQRLILWPQAITEKHQYERLLTHGFVVDGRGAIRASRGFPFTLSGIEAATG